MSNTGSCRYTEAFGGRSDNSKATNNSVKFSIFLLAILFAALVAILFPIRDNNLKLQFKSNVNQVQLYCDKGQGYLQAIYSHRTFKTLPDGMFLFEIDLPKKHAEKFLIRPMKLKFTGDFIIEDLMLKGYKFNLKIDMPTLVGMIFFTNGLLNLKVENDTLISSIVNDFPLLGINTLSNSDINHRVIEYYRAGKMSTPFIFLISMSLISIFVLLLFAFTIKYSEHLDVFGKLLVSKKRQFIFLLSITLIIDLIVFRKYLLLKNYLLFYDCGNDTFVQMWPFFTDFVRNIKTGMTWSSYLGIGAPKNCISSLYGLYDPFNLIFLLVNPDVVPSVFIFSFLIKQLVAIIGFFLLMHRWKYHVSAIIGGALIYGFSGYLIGFGSWVAGWGAATCAFLPWILLAIDSAWYNQKKWVLPIIISLFFVSSYSWFACFQIGFICWIIITIENFFFRKEFAWKTYGKNLTTLIWTFFLGIGLVGFVSIPDLHSLVNNTVNVRSGLMESVKLLIPIEEASAAILRLFSNDLLGSAGQNSYNTFGLNYIEQPFIYCGLITLILTIFALSKKIGKSPVGIKLLILVAFVFTTSPMLRSIFWTGFASYHRMTNILQTFLLIWLAVDVFSSYLSLKNNQPREILLVTSFLLVLLWAGLFICKKIRPLSIIDIRLSTAITAFLLGYCLLFICLKMEKQRSSVLLLMLLMLCIELGYQTHVTINVNRHASYPKIVNLNPIRQILENISKTDNEWFRISKNFRIIGENDPLLLGYCGFCSYSSINPIETLNFFRAMGNPVHSHAFCDDVIRESIRCLLGMKYHLTQSPNGTISVSKTDYYIPFGAFFNRVISEKEFHALSDADRELVLLTTLVLNENSMKNELFKEFSVSGDEILTEATVVNIIREKQSSSGILIKNTPDQIEFRTKIKSAGLLFFAIPNNPGWQVMLDGIKAEIIEVNSGLMAIFANPGEHKIELKYSPPYRKFGIWVSVASWILLLIIYLNFGFFRKKTPV